MQFVEFKAIVLSLHVVIMEVLLRFMALKLGKPLGSIQLQIHLYEKMLMDVINYIFVTNS